MAAKELQNDVCTLYAHRFISCWHVGTLYVFLPAILYTSRCETMQAELAAIHCVPLQFEVTRPGVPLLEDVVTVTPKSAARIWLRTKQSKVKLMK